MRREEKAKPSPSLFKMKAKPRSYFTGSRKFYAFFAPFSSKNSLLPIFVRCRNFRDPDGLSQIQDIILNVMLMDC